MGWKNFSQCTEQVLFRGSRLRVTEDVNGQSQTSDLMLIDISDSNGMSLVELDGYHAGHVVVTFPLNSCPKNTRGLSVAWLLHHGKNKIPSEGTIERILINTGKPHPPRMQKQQQPVQE
jgi:hypothetical protein